MLLLILLVFLKIILCLVSFLVAVVVAFFICWAPFHAQRLVYIYGVNTNHQPSDPLILKLFIITTYISGILYYLSTCINPLLYNIMSNKFRQAFKVNICSTYLCRTLNCCANIHSKLSITFLHDKPTVKTRTK